MPNHPRKPLPDPGNDSLSIVEQETAEEADIQNQIDSAADVPSKPRPPTDPPGDTRSSRK